MGAPRKYCYKCGRDKVPGSRCEPCRKERENRHYDLKKQRGKNLQGKMIVCPRCRTERKQFHKSGVKTNCPKCYDEWRESNADAVRKQNREYIAQKRVEYPEESKKYLDEWVKANPGKVKAHQLKVKYGITQAEYDFMFASQNGVCAICHRPEHRISPRSNGQIKRLAVDHDHKTGEVRALLCGGCNPGLGYFCDDPELLRKAADYLESFSK